MALPRSAVFVLTALAVASVWFAQSEEASACSADADWDPAANSEVIVGGFIERYTPLPDRDRVGMFVPVRLEMRTDHVWKGSVRPGAEIVDRTSFMFQPVRTDKEEIRIVWAGSAGACGALNEDPSGQYAVFGLFAAPDGTLQTTSLRTFYLSAQPYDPATVARLSQRIALPVAGQGAESQEGTSLEALLVAGVVLCVGGGALRARSATRRSGQV